MRAPLGSVALLPGRQSSEEIRWPLLAAVQAASVLGVQGLPALAAVFVSRLLRSGLLDALQELILAKTPF